MTKRTSRSWTQLIILSLFLGFATTFVVAWLPAMFTTFDLAPSRYGSVLMWLESSGDSVRAEWHFASSRSTFGTQVTSTVACQGGLYDPVGNLTVRELPTWSAISTHPFVIDAVAGHLSTWDERAFGWPYLALRGSTQALHDGYEFSVAATKHVILLEAPNKYRGTGARFLPLNPMWGGLIMNSAVFAITYVCIFSSGIICRRGYRRSRGCCVKCAYDLRATKGGVCPECGTTMMP